MQLLIGLVLVAACRAKVTLLAANRQQSECRCHALEPRVRRIVGGTTLGDHQGMPWMAALLDIEDRLMGGATILNQRFLLTAAHICNGTKPDELTAAVGINRISRNTAKVQNRTMPKVARCIEHPNFDPVTGVNDIAILELYEPLPFGDNVAPVCLSAPSGNNVVFVSGWGKTEEDALGPSEDLRVAKLIKASLIQCQSEFGPESVPAEQVICAIGRSRDACQGDSGGPLMENLLDRDMWTQLGIVSWGFGCGRPHTPGIYTKVEYYLPWMTSVVNSFCIVQPAVDFVGNAIYNTN
ncbi:trypsin alpha-3-like [Varroa destructor]|uniref:Peptidase S1 domain-containing protein n=1 Tax=Varroa destructor TaxID=109461 RepID=A0A7M7MB83_VARDE|nr:trypsin alpha-3-like [Varroa destructor]